MAIIIELIHIISRAFTILVIAEVFVSYFLSPYHPVREVLSRIIEPFIAPIRRIVPPVGMIDFSPIVLIVIVQVVDFILTSVLLSIR